MLSTSRISSYHCISYRFKEAVVQNWNPCTICVFLGWKLLKHFKSKFKNVKKTVLAIVKLMHSLYNVFYTLRVCNKLTEFKVLMNVPEAISIPLNIIRLVKICFNILHWVVLECNEIASSVLSYFTLRGMWTEVALTVAKSWALLLFPGKQLFPEMVCVRPCALPHGV